MFDHKHWPLALVLSMLAIATLACSLLGSEETSSLGGGEIGGPNVGPSSTLPFVDDFSDSTSGWEEGDYPSGTVGYRDGEYFVQALENSALMWGQAFVDLADVEVEVIARQISGPANDNTGYGVMCRLKANEDGEIINGYSLLISGDGYYAITKWSNGESSELVDWATSDEINTGTGVNTLRVRCEGERLTLYVNGNMVAEALDSSFTQGDLALAGVSFEDGEAEFRFDDLTARSP
jgi:hypothetical protein